MRVLIFQPSYQGHHFAFLARMLPGFVDLPIEIVIATTRAAVASAEYEKTLAPFRDRVEIATCCTRPPARGLANARHRTREMVAAAARFKPDHLCAVYGDGLWQMLAVRSMLGRWPFPRTLPVELWIYRGAFAYSRRRPIRFRMQRLLFDSILRNDRFAALHLDDELLFEYAAATQRIGAKTRLVLTPNPVWIGPKIDRTEARRRLGLPEEGRIVSLTGMISPSKGAILLLDAFRCFVETAGEPDDRLILAGPHSAEAKTKLGCPPFADWLAAGRIVSEDRFLPEKEMYTFAAASDLVTAPYPHHQGRSSIILWAAAAGRPSLGTSRECIGHVIDSNRLGLTCDVNDIRGFSEKLRKGLTLDWQDDDEARVRKYARFHSLENFQQSSSALVRERIKTSTTTNSNGT